MPFPSLELVYFDFGGRAEATRLAFFIGDVPFRDVRVPYNDGFSSSQQGANYPYAMLPVLKVDGVTIAESMAMLRFAGRLTGLYPVNDPIGALLIDEILEMVEVFTERCLRWERETDITQQRTLEEELTNSIIPHSFYAIDAQLAALETHPMFASSFLYIHDLVLRSFVRYIIRPDWERFVTDRAKITHWLASIEKVEGHPKVQQYYALQMTTSEQPLQLKDTTFDPSSRGEPIRMALRIGGVAFEDVQADDLSLVLSDGRIVRSFFSILRHVGTLSGLYPAAQDELLSFKIDELLGQLEELHNWWYYPSYTIGDTMKEQAFAKELATKTIPKFLTMLDRRVGEWARPYATGSKLTIADLVIWGMINQLENGLYLRDAPVVSTTMFENLRKITQQVQQYPKTTSRS